jgi:hypothetical protein
MLLQQGIQRTAAVGPEALGLMLLGLLAETVGPESVHQSRVLLWGVPVGAVAEAIRQAEAQLTGAVLAGQGKATDPMVTQTPEEVEEGLLNLPPLQFAPEGTVAPVW